MVAGGVVWISRGGVGLVVLGMGRYPCKCCVAQQMVLVSPSSTLMWIARVLSLGSRSSAVQMLRAHRHALEAASHLMSVFQHLVMEVMKWSVLWGILAPCRNAGHHAWGIEKSLRIVVMVPLVPTGTVGVLR